MYIQYLRFAYTFMLVHIMEILSYTFLCLYKGTSLFDYVIRYVGIDSFYRLIYQVYAYKTYITNQYISLLAYPLLLQST